MEQLELKEDELDCRLERLARQETRPEQALTGTLFFFDDSNPRTWPPL